MEDSEDSEVWAAWAALEQWVVCLEVSRCPEQQALLSNNQPALQEPLKLQVLPELAQVQEQQVLRPILLLLSEEWEDLEVA